jgi:hypothetical protein
VGCRCQARKLDQKACLGVPTTEVMVVVTAGEAYKSPGIRRVHLCGTHRAMAYRDSVPLYRLGPARWAAVGGHHLHEAL